MTVTTSPRMNTNDEVLTTEQAYWQVANTYDAALSREQEQQLVNRARSGGEQERNDLLLYLLPRVIRFAYHQARIWDSHRVEHADLVGDASIVILSKMDRALSEANDAVGYLFSVACEAIRAYAKRLHYPISTPFDVEPFSVTSLDASLPGCEDFTLLDALPDSTSEIETQQSEEGKYAAVDAALCMLKDQERELIIRRFGLSDNAPESVNDILRSMGQLTNKHLMGRTLSKLRIQLQDAYPQYCSPTREVRRYLAVGLKPLTQEQEQRLQAAHERLQSQGISVSVRKLAREAHIGDHVAERYLMNSQTQTPPPTQEERLNQALKEIQARGEKITQERLAREAHVDTGATGLYLHALSVYQKGERRRATASRVSQRTLTNYLLDTLSPQMAEGARVSHETQSM